MTISHDLVEGVLSVLRENRKHAAQERTLCRAEMIEDVGELISPHCRTARHLKPWLPSPAARAGERNAVGRASHAMKVIPAAELDN